jgi:hypothetical protein
MERYNLFEVYGVELEYMLVDAETLEVRPVADDLLASLAGHPTSDVQQGDVTWSNELASHVVELKTTQPSSGFAELPSLFSDAIAGLQPTLRQQNLRLLPSAMHPWMDPRTETRLWPHENAEIYQAFHRIFDCFNHGWANVQSVHLNLPFGDDSQFRKLHAAVRLVLPLLPALAASSPVFDARVGRQLDSRLVHYIGHCARVPSLTGNVIPEPIYDQSTYRRHVFGPIACDIEPLDIDQVMEVEFLNARGAIARFDRGSVELRLMDVQEYSAADVAICAVVSAVTQMLVEQSWSTTEHQCKVASEALRQILDLTVRDADQSVLDQPDYLRHFGLTGKPMTACEIWSVLVERTRSAKLLPAEIEEPVKTILTHGTLARRIHQSLGSPPTDTPIDRQLLLEVYRHLSDCLLQGVPFLP